MLRVLYDDQIFSEQAYGGISQFYIELFRQYRSEADMRPFLALGDTDNISLRSMPIFRQGYGRMGPFKRKIVRTYDRYMHQHCLKELNRRLSIKMLRARDYDVFHPTYYDPYFLDHLSGKPYVLTVHDLIYEIFFPEERQMIDWKRKLIDYADRIIAVSENTRQDVMRLLDIPPSKVGVIHLGAPLILSEEPNLAPSERYLLFIGNRAYYKNFSAFIEAVAPMLREDPSLDLVCGGGPPFDQNEMRVFGKLGIAHQVRREEITEVSRSQLYRNAMAFVFPSLYEGFGLPVLEAMANLCPAILSNRASLPEIGGDAAVYFDPEDSDGMRSAIGSVIYDPAIREELIRRGADRARAFSWERCASEYKAIYCSLV